MCRANGFLLLLGPSLLHFAYTQGHYSLDQLALTILQ